MRAFLAELASMGATLKEVPNDALPGMPGSPLTVDTAAAFDFHWGEQAIQAAQGNGEAPPTRFTNGRDDTALDYVNTQRQVLLQWNSSQVYTKTVAYFAQQLAQGQQEQ